MKVCSKRIPALCLAVLLAVTAVFPASAAHRDTPTVAPQSTVSAPQPGAVTGGEWSLIGIARGGVENPPREMLQKYYDDLMQYVFQLKGQLHDRKYTEFSRIVLAVTAVGGDPANVGGYDLLAPLADYDKVVWQGVNGPIWALIALDSGDYPMPKAPAGASPATRQRYLDAILAAQLPDGGWSITDKEPSDPDMTAMAIQALAGYRNDGKVSLALNRAIGCLSAMQLYDGGFASSGTPTSESCSQVILALCALGISPADSRFVRGGMTPLAALLEYQLPDGGFSHVKGGESNRMATEQAFLALTAYKRYLENQPGLFDMTDVAVKADTHNPKGLPGRHEDVRFKPVIRTGVTFTDTTDPAVLALAARDLVSGIGDGRYLPQSTMLRCEFSSAVVRTLGLPRTLPVAYGDVPAGAWFAAPVSTASTYDIVSGVGGGNFAPSNTITRQEGMVMLTKAAKLAGLDTALTEAEVAQLLDGYSDVAQVKDWARSSTAFCLKSGILPAGSLLEPARQITRVEMAQFLYRLMENADLL